MALPYATPSQLNKVNSKVETIENSLDDTLYVDIKDIFGDDFLVNEKFQKYYQICSGAASSMTLVNMNADDFAKQIIVDTDKINKIIIKMDIDSGDGNPVHAEMIYYKVTDTNASNIHSNVWYNCSYCIGNRILLGIGCKKETKEMNSFIGLSIALLD